MKQIVTFFIAFVLLAVLPPALQAQRKSAEVKGKVVDAVKKTPLESAVVSVRFGSDSLHRVTDRNGLFSVGGLRTGEVQIRVTFLGYKAVEKRFTLGSKDVDLGTIALEEDVSQIDAVTVEGEVPLMTQTGDTIKYNAAAIKSLTDDFAVDLVEKLPGVEVDEEGGVTAMGKTVDWAFVDGKLLFGRNVENTLNNLRASDIQSVRVYDVANPEKPIDPNNIREEDKQRVIDIETKSKPNHIYNIELRGGWGRDVDNPREGTPQNRYTGSGEIRSFREKLMLGLSAYGNNITGQGNRFRGRFGPIPDEGGSVAGYSRYNGASLNIDRSNPFLDRDKLRFSVGYSFSNQHNENGNVSQKIYFKDDRFTADTSSSGSDSYSHDVNLRLMKIFDNRIFSIFSTSFSATENQNEQERATLAMLGDQLLNYVPTFNRNRTRSYSTSGSLNVMIPLKKPSSSSETAAEAQTQPVPAQVTAPVVGAGRFSTGRGPGAGGMSRGGGTRGGAGGGPVIRRIRPGGVVTVTTPEGTEIVSGGTNVPDSTQSRGGVTDSTLRRRMLPDSAFRRRIMPDSMAGGRVVPDSVARGQSPVADDAKTLEARPATENPAETKPAATSQAERPAARVVAIPGGAGGPGVPGRGPMMMNMSRPYRLMPILGTRVQWSYSDSRGNGLRDTWQADSTASDPTRTVLTTHSGGYKKGIDAAVSLHDLQIWNTLSLNSSYQFNYDHSKSRQLAIDNMTGLIDSTVAFNYTRNYITQQLDERFVWFLREKSMEIRVGAIFKTSWSDRDEHMPRELFDRRTFISLLPQFTIGSRYEESFPSSPNWKVTYSAQSSEPSLESMRNWLDTKSSMSLELGNPSLKQSYTHSIDMNFFKSNVEESTTLNLSLSASYTHNDIATKRITFNQDTPLPEYDYTALAGSTLTTYENIDGAVSSALRFGLHNPVFKDKFILRSSLGFSFNRRPAYIADQKNFTLSSSPSLDLELRSNHSRKVEYRISSRTGYVYSSNTAGGDNKSFTQRAAFHLTLRLEHLEFNTSYMYYYYHSTKAADVNNNILNASLSYRFMKNRGELRIAAYDILNRNESFSSSVYSDYVQNTWRQVMSRYFTVTLGFRFNNSGMPSRPPRS